MVPLTAAVLLQAPLLQPQLDRIAVSQVVMAISMAVVTLTILAVGIAASVLFVRARKLIATVEAQTRALVPRAEPILTVAGKVAADATDLSAAVKARVDEVLDTIHELNERIRDLGAETEERVREFGAVLDVVQEEAREILLDATATARGVHATAEALQGVAAKKSIRSRS